MASGSRTPYVQFAKIISSYQSTYSDPGPSTQLDSPLRHDAILNRDGGLLTSLMQALEETIRSAPGSGMKEMISEEQLSEEERQALLAEHRTWQLIRTVYEHRLYWDPPPGEEGYDKRAMEKDPYMPPGDICKVIEDVDEDLSFFATLVEHLQSRPLLNAAPPLESRHGYLPTTLRRTKNAVLKGGSGAGGAPIPASLDPDFTVRDPHVQTLAGEDATYQIPLLDTLWDHVRHGELDAAIRVCDRGGEPWRGATLMGGHRWSMGGLWKMAYSPAEGNRTRALWKKSCRAIAKNPLLSASERSVYAALISDLPTLLPACKSWEDHLWAQLAARLEYRLEARYRQIGGFWEAESRNVGEDDGFVTVGGGLDEVFARMAQLQEPKIRTAFSDPYHVAQRYIIQGKADLLLSQFADRLPLDGNMSPELIAPLLRFFTHLVLILRNIGQPVPDLPANAIIESYLRILEQEGNDGLVAMYAACLRQGNGEESYARFLRSMDPEATRELRLEALNRAKQHHLDVVTIARETVRLILDEALVTLDDHARAPDDIEIFASGLTEDEVYLIRSLEWLLFQPETVPDALVRANEVSRFFLSRGRANAAQALLKTLPSGIEKLAYDHDESENALEFEQIRALFVVFANYEIIEDILGVMPKATATKVEQHNWRKGLLTAIERTRTVTIELLTSDWLRFHIPSSSSPAPLIQRRKKELRRIRSIFIPDLVLRLHSLLMTHSSMFPQLLDQALDLTKVVAKDDNCLYPEFFSSEGRSWKLELYLDKVREAALALMKRGGEHAFAI